MATTSHSLTLTTRTTFEGLHTPPLLPPRPVDRQAAGQACPKLSTRKDGSFSVRQELPPREDTRRTPTRAWSPRPRPGWYRAQGRPARRPLPNFQGCRARRRRCSTRAGLCRSIGRNPGARWHVRSRKRPRTRSPGPNRAPPWEENPGQRLAGCAPGRIRTCDTRFRRAVLYPLSYEGEAWRPGGEAGPPRSV